MHITRLLPAAGSRVGAPKRYRRRIHGFRDPGTLIFILAYSLRREFEEKTGNSKTVSSLRERVKQRGSHDKLASQNAKLRRLSQLHGDALHTRGDRSSAGL